MKCNNFFCVDYDKGFTQGNCARHILGDTNDCPQRKAFNRFKKRLPNSLFPYEISAEFEQIKKELEGQK